MKAFAVVATSTSNRPAIEGYRYNLVDVPVGEAAMLVNGTFGGALVTVTLRSIKGSRPSLTGTPWHEKTYETTVLTAVPEEINDIIELVSEGLETGTINPTWMRQSFRYRDNSLHHPDMAWEDLA